MFASRGGEGCQSFFISGGDEAEIWVAWVKEIVLIHSVAESTFGWRCEAGLEDSFAIDDEAGGVAPAKKEAMGAGGESDFGRGA